MNWFKKRESRDAEYTKWDDVCINKKCQRRKAVTLPGLGHFRGYHSCGNCIYFRKFEGFLD